MVDLINRVDSFIIIYTKTNWNTSSAVIYKVLGDK